MTDIAIHADGIGKAYRLGSQEDRADTFVEAMLNLVKVPLRNLNRLRRLDTFRSAADGADLLWALKDISFEIKQGEVVGFVGRNGAGKSTLLKILSRITDPTEGRAEIRGRVSSLLEVGTGFHPELSGRENVYMNGTILGMKKAEIDRKFDEIVAFSGVERFLDTPVKRYSSGMKVRLAFSVAAHLQPEVLIVDEVLAVGDAEFQKRSLGKMQEVAGGGRTVLFVSHNMGAIQNLCSRAIALRNGQLVDEGVPEVVIRRYLASMTSDISEAFSLNNPDRTGSGDVRLIDGYPTNKLGERCDSVVAGEPMSLKFHYEATRDVNHLRLMFTVYNETGVGVTNLHNELTDFSIQSPGRSGVITCSIAKAPFPVGEYRVAAALDSYGQKLDHLPAAFSFSVRDSVFFGTSKIPNRQFCTAYVDHEWSVEPDAVGTTLAASGAHR